MVRAYNPFIEGWLAAKCAKELKIPFLLSLHTQYDSNRQILKKTNFKKYLALKYTEKFIEPYVLKSADKITAIYRIIEPYVLKQCHNKPEILHNKVDCEKFVNATTLESLQKPLIISVGALIPVKNHECVILSMKNVNANLMIIGNGLLHDKLQELIQQAIDFSIIDVSGSWFTCDFAIENIDSLPDVIEKNDLDEKTAEKFFKVQGQKKLKDLMLNNPSMITLLDNTIREMLM